MNDGSGLKELSIYPARLAEHLDLLVSDDLQIKPLELSKKELKIVLGYEIEWLAKLSSLDKLSPKIHTIYPGWLMTKEGWQTAREVYGEVGIVLEEKEPATIREVEEVFFQLPDLSQIDKEKREKVENGSKEWARDKFIREFETADGNLEQMEDPYRISKIGDKEALRIKAQSLRDLKKEIKQAEESLEKDNSNLGEAKRIILRLHRRSLNTILANLYTEGAVLSKQPNLSAEDKEILADIRGRDLNSESKGDRLVDESIGRTLERLDHYLQGVGLKIGEDGNFRAIPGEVESFIEKRAQESWQETPQYREFLTVLVSDKEAEMIARRLLESQGKTDWKTRIRPKKKALAIVYKEEGQVVKCLDIPGDLAVRPRPLPELFLALVHEIGHVLRYSNAGEIPLGLILDIGTGRSGGLAEAGANFMQDRVAEILFGIKRKFGGYYYWALKAKKDGGSFKDCFAAVLKSQKGIDPTDAFRRTLRIFNGGIPLSDKSGLLVSSGGLSYHEEELVAKKLDKLRLTKLLFVGNVDVYSIFDLQRLSMLNWGDLQAPDYLKISQVWREIAAKK